MDGRFSLRRSYLVLIALMVVFTVLSFVFKDEWFRSYFSNIAAGIIGSLFVIFLIDRIIERSMEKQRFEIVRIALERLRIPILWHMQLLCNIYKAAAQKKPTPLPSTFEDTCKDDYYKEISFLDFTKEAPVAPRRNWFTHLDLETKSFKEKLEKVTDTYANSFDVRLIRLLERIINSRLFLIIPQMKNIPVVDRQEGFPPRVYTMFAGMEEFVKEHVSSMLELIKYFNATLEPPIQLSQEWWREDVAPTWGSGRLVQKKGKNK